MDGDQTDVEQLRKILDRRGTALKHVISYPALTPYYSLRTTLAGPSPAKPMMILSGFYMLYMSTKNSTDLIMIQRPFAFDP